MRLGRAWDGTIYVGLDLDSRWAVWRLGRKRATLERYCGSWRSARDLTGTLRRFKEAA